MAMIADSDAAHDIRRILPQHQAAITLLNAKLQNPSVKNYTWLDLACGKGQIISQLSENLSANHRVKLSYVGYDINPEHTRTAERTAASLGLASYSFLHGDISSFNSIVGPESKFDFITCTNTAHELQPGAFSQLLLSALKRLTPTGDLFIYDMELVMKSELGALPWRGAEISSLLKVLFGVIDSEYRAEPSVWSHTTCKGWSALIQRGYIGKADEELDSAQKLISEHLEHEIDRILAERLRECDKVLESYCRYGAETAEDQTTKMLALYEFWALHRARGMRA